MVVASWFGFVQIAGIGWKEKDIRRFALIVGNPLCERKMMLDNTRRRRIRAAIKELQKDKSNIDEVRDILEDILSEEENVRDNTPESFHELDRYQICEESCDLLEQAIDDLSNEEDTDIEAVLDTLAQIDGI